MVFTPWAIRDWLVFGSPLPGQTVSNALSVTGFDIFAWNDPPTLARYLAVGPARLLEMRVDGVAHNVLNVLLLLGLPISVVGMLALPWQARDRVLRPVVLLAATTFLVTSLLFPVATTWGTFLHAAAPVHVLLVISALGVLDAGLARLGARLGWTRPVAWLGAVLAVGGSFLFAVALLPGAGRGALATQRTYEVLARQMAAAGSPLDGSHPVIHDFPIWLAEAARIPTLALPEESPSDVLDLARDPRFDARWLIVGKLDDGLWPGILTTSDDPAAACFDELHLPVPARSRRRRRHRRPACLPDRVPDRGGWRHRRPGDAAVAVGPARLHSQRWTQPGANRRAPGSMSCMPKRRRRSRTPRTPSGRSATGTARPTTTTWPGGSRWRTTWARWSAMTNPVPPGPLTAAAPIDAEGAAAAEAGAADLRLQMVRGEVGRSRSELGRHEAELSRLELAIRNLESTWLFMERGDAMLVTEPSLPAISTELQMRILEAQESERARLAQEVHDGPAQALSNAIFQVEFIDRVFASDPRLARTELRFLRELLRRELGDVRTFLTQLRPPVLAELGLDGAIMDTITTQAALSGLHITGELGASSRRAGRYRPDRDPARRPGSPAECAQARRGHERGGVERARGWTMGAGGSRRWSRLRYRGSGGQGPSQLRIAVHA